MKTAYCLIRPGPEYRREAFHAGIKACGFDLKTEAPSKFKSGELLVIWNRYWHMDDLATVAERDGARVVVAENGYFLRPHFGGGHYALALDGHNGQGRWPEGDGDRWRSLAIDLKPWRKTGSHILICPNRPFGRRGHTMDSEWAKRTIFELRKHTKRDLRLRIHPGNNEPPTPIERDLENAWACVIWYSSAGVRALVQGVPVIYCAPSWICGEAAGTALTSIENPPMPDRARAFQRLAWAQWTLPEITSGEAFRTLLAVQ